MTAASRRQGTSAAPPPQATVPDPQRDDGDDPRRVAHELVGQAHAVLVIAHRQDVLGYWCPPELRDVTPDAGAPLWLAVGDMQAAIGSGTHDEFLAGAGLAGALSRPKRKGLRGALERLARAVDRRRPASIRRWLKNAAGLARTAVGSMSERYRVGRSSPKPLTASCQVWTRSTPSPRRPPRSKLAPCA
jgi:hypothetical protein